MKKLLFFCILTAFLCSCTTVVNSHTRKAGLLREYTSGQYAAALKHVETKLGDGGFFSRSAIGTGDEIMWRLEGGTLYFLNGKYADAIRQFNAAEARMNEYEERAKVSVRDLGSEGASILTNPAAIPYRGWCRDKMLLPVYRALAYLGKGDADGFRTELYHLRELQNRVREDYDRYFDTEKRALNAEASKHPSEAQKMALDPYSDTRNSEFARAAANTKKTADRGYGNFMNPLTVFLSGYGYWRDRDWENALVDFERLGAAMPGHPLVKRYRAAALRYARRSVPAELQSVPALDFNPTGNNVLVIFANGLSPAFRQVAVYFPVPAAWPVCEYYPAAYKNLQIRAGGKTYDTLPVSDMDAIMSREYRDRLPAMIARIVLSFAIKEAAADAAIYAASRQDPYAGMAVAVAAKSYQAVFNTADTRSWEILPKEYQIAQFAMPADRIVTLAPDGVNPFQVKIPKAAGSAILLVNAPARGAVACYPFYLPK